MATTIPLILSEQFGASEIAIVTAKPWKVLASVTPGNGPFILFTKTVRRAGDFMAPTISLNFSNRRPGQDYRFHVTFETRVAGELDYGEWGMFPTLADALACAAGHVDAFKAVLVEAVA